MLVGLYQSKTSPMGNSNAEVYTYMQIEQFLPDYMCVNSFFAKCLTLTEGNDISSKKCPCEVSTLQLHQVSLGPCGDTLACQVTLLTADHLLPATSLGLPGGCCIPGATWGWGKLTVPVWGKELGAGSFGSPAAKRVGAELPHEVGWPRGPCPAQLRGFLPRLYPGLTSAPAAAGQGVVRGTAGGCQARREPDHQQQAQHHHQPG